jgi:hypothetical protein
MEHHIYVPLHEAELQLALEIGHGILCEKNWALQGSKESVGILHYTSIMKPEARGERYAVGEGPAIPEYLGIIHTNC